MQSIFLSAIRRIALVFFEDILVYSTTWVEHLEHLHSIFSLFRTKQLFAKRSKCAFGCSRIGYLGHQISGKGVKVDPEKIVAIQQWPLPTNIPALRGFLGLSGYYCHFVHDYAFISSPLSDLLQKNTFIWTPAATKAFKDLKYALIHIPVLQFPDFNYPFEIHTDASTIGISVVLLQNQHPVAYFSK